MIPKAIKDFLRPLVIIEDHQRKIKAIIEPFEGEDDFVRNVSIKQLHSIINSLSVIIENKVNRGDEVSDDREFANLLSQLIQTKQNEQA